MVALVGLISDTHDLVRPEALTALAGVELILHAGDVCSPAVLSVLERIAPVRAVRGNNDRGGWASALPESDVVQVGGTSIFMLHDLHALALGDAQPSPSWSAGTRTGRTSRSAGACST